MSAASKKILEFDRTMSDATGGDAWAEFGGDMTGAKTRTGEPPTVGGFHALEIAQIALLESEIGELKTQVARIADAGEVLIETLAPASCELMRPFHVSVGRHEDGFRASFADANLMAFGDTAPEAVWNLKDLLVDTYEALSALDEERLGPGPVRQLAVMRHFIR